MTHAATNNNCGAPAMTYHCDNNCGRTVTIPGARCAVCGAQAQPDDTPYVKPKHKVPWGSRNPEPVYPWFGTAADHHERIHQGGTRKAGA